MSTHTAGMRPPGFSTNFFQKSLSNKAKLERHYKKIFTLYDNKVPIILKNFYNNLWNHTTNNLINILMYVTIYTFNDTIKNLSEPKNLENIYTPNICDAFSYTTIDL